MICNRYLIEELKYGCSEGGIACGPCSGEPVISIRYSMDSETKWAHLVIASGCTVLIVSDDNLFENLLDDSYIEENIDMLNSLTVKDMNGIDVSDDFYTLNESVREHPENPAAHLMKIFLEIYYCDDADRGPFMESVKGRYADEVTVHEDEWDL